MSKEIQFLLYSLPDEEGKVQVVVKDETLWCTQKAMAQLFGVGVPAISKHLGHIFEEGELDRTTTVSKMEIVVNRGFRGSVNEEVEFYSLDAIIAVGYRVSSLKATRFRQWATKILHEYIKKGFVMDDERLKQGTAVFGKDYFRELLERVRSIRASERRIWQQITDIYAECSTDYDKNAPTTRDFYAMIQNRFHYAITGQTAAEIVYTKADHTKEHMGLTTWKNAPDGRILKSDVSIAKIVVIVVSPTKMGLCFAGHAASRYRPIQEVMVLVAKVTIPQIQRLEGHGLILSMSMWEMTGLQTLTGKFFSQTFLNRIQLKRQRKSLFVGQRRQLPICIPYRKTGRILGCIVEC